MRILSLLGCLSLLLTACATHSTPPATPAPPAAGPHLAPNAPPDKPVAVAAGENTSFEKMLAPCTAKARASFPGAERRFAAGLPAGQSLFAVTALHDSLDHVERVFVAVDSIKGGEIFGRIWSEIMLVRGYKLKEPYHFPESDLLDWMISMPDGSEDGNWSGKFLDAFQATGNPPKGVC